MTAASSSTGSAHRHRSDEVAVAGRRRAVIAAVVVAGLLVIGHQAKRAVGQARDRASGPYHEQAAATAALLACMNRRLSAVLPAHARVFFDPGFATLDDGLITQRLSELAFPRFDQVFDRAEATYLLTAERSLREGACDGIAIDAAALR